MFLVLADADTPFLVPVLAVVLRELVELPLLFDLGVIIEALLCTDRVLDLGVEVLGVSVLVEPETVDEDIDADDLEAELYEGLSIILGLPDTVLDLLGSEED